MTDTDPAADRAIQALEEQLGLLNRRTRAIFQRLARQVHPDLDPAALGLLMIVQQEQAVRLTDLAVRIGVGKPSISRQVAMLERLGLVEKSADPMDGRAQTISMTEMGTRKLEQARAARKELFRGLMQDWRIEDIETLAALLGQLQETYSRDGWSPSN